MLLCILQQRCLDSILVLMLSDGQCLRKDAEQLRNDQTRHEAEIEANVCVCKLWAWALQLGVRQHCRAAAKQMPSKSSTTLPNRRLAIGKLLGSVKFTVDQARISEYEKQTNRVDKRAGPGHANRIAD